MRIVTTDIKTMVELLIYALEYMYCAMQQITKVLPKMIEHSNNGDLPMAEKCNKRTERSIELAIY